MFDVPPSPYDLRFQVAGIPVRVHPLFWAAGLLLGGLDSEPSFLLIWIPVVFVSILIHELGHALLMRHFGQSPHIVLYMGGGYASSHSGYDSFSFQSSKRLTHAQHIIVLLGGPGAGFLFAALIFVALAVSGQEVTFRADFPFFWRFEPFLGREQLTDLVWSLLTVNILWGLMNLVPVYPLDGGQIAREVFLATNPWNGLVYSLYLSLAAGIAMVVAGLYYQEMFIAILFGFFAYQTYMTLQQMGGGGGYGQRPW